MDYREDDSFESEQYPPIVVTIVDQPEEISFIVRKHTDNREEVVISLPKSKNILPYISQADSDEPFLTLDESLSTSLLTEEDKVILRLAQEGINLVKSWNLLKDPDKELRELQRQATVWNYYGFLDTETVNKLEEILKLVNSVLEDTN